MERKPGRTAPIVLLTVLLVMFLFGAARADVVINEVMASNGFYENGEAYDWIELYNNGSKAVDMSGWYLSDSKKEPLKWSFPEGTKLKAGGYLTVYCTGEPQKSKGKGSTFYTLTAPADALHVRSEQRIDTRNADYDRRRRRFAFLQQLCTCLRNLLQIAPRDDVGIIEHQIEKALAVAEFIEQRGISAAAARRDKQHHGAGNRQPCALDAEALCTRRIVIERRR